MIKSSPSRVAFGTRSILGPLVAAAMPATACNQWLAPAQMEVIQGNGPRIGFSVIQEGTKIHGFPALGARGRVMMDPGTTSIRDALSASGQRGFDASVNSHLARM